MSHNWKPGDVALATWDDGKSEILFRYLSGDKYDRPEWQSAEDGEAYPTNRQVRPLLVIDPEDREQVRELLATYGRQFTDWTPELDSNVTRLQDALRSLLTPPKPEEPTGLGAVVEDADGHRWVRASRTSTVNHWRCADESGMGRKPYAKVTAVRVLSEGVKS